MGRSTEQFAAGNLVKRDSVLSRLSRFGHYFGVKPRKLPNGRLLWPDEDTRARSERTGDEPAAAHAPADATP
jgi:hypothetical protein